MTQKEEIADIKSEMAILQKTAKVLQEEVQCVRTGCKLTLKEMYWLRKRSSVNEVTILCVRCGARKRVIGALATKYIIAHYNLVGSAPKKGWTIYSVGESK